MGCRIRTSIGADARAGVNGVVRKLSCEESRTSWERCTRRPANSGPDSAEFGADLGQTRPVFDRIRPKSGVGLGRIRPNSAEIWTRSTKFAPLSTDSGPISGKCGRHPPSLPKSGPDRSNPVEIWSKRSKVVQMSAKFGRIRPRFGRIRPMFRRVRSKSSHTWPKSAPNRSGLPRIRLNLGQIGRPTREHLPTTA